MTPGLYLCLDLAVAALAVVAFLAGSLWREAVWRLTIGGTLAQVRARRTATLRPPDTHGPVVDLAELRERRRAFDARIGSYRGRPS